MNNCARGVDLSRGRSGIELQAQPIIQFIEKDFVAVDPQTSVKEAIKALLRRSPARVIASVRTNRSSGSMR